MDRVQALDELSRIAAESIDGLLMLFDILADGEPEGFDWEAHRTAARQREERISELMALLKRDDILKASDIKTETVPVPEWGGEVMVRGLTGAERDRLENSVIKSNGKNRSMNLHNIRAKMVALSVVDEQGNRLFSDTDASVLGHKSAAALDRVFGVAQRLSGLTDDDVEDLAKNSDAGQSDDFGSA